MERGFHVHVFDMWQMLARHDEQGHDFDAFDNRRPRRSELTSSREIDQPHR
jgi:hypothetical protein